MLTKADIPISKPHIIHGIINNIYTLYLHPLTNTISIVLWSKQHTYINIFIIMIQLNVPHSKWFIRQEKITVAISFCVVHKSQ